ncbi:MAG: LUD domain-containing protein [Thermomicrobiales bacterium]
MGRDKSIKEISFEDLKASLIEAKDKVLADHEAYIAQFEENVTRNGAIVHHATTADDARRIVREIAEARGIDLIVKSKSMVTEEIELNHYLDEFDIEPVETDLGSGSSRRLVKGRATLSDPRCTWGARMSAICSTTKLGIPTPRDIIRSAGTHDPGRDPAEVLRSRHGHDRRERADRRNRDRDDGHQRRKRAARVVGAAGPW